MWIVFTVLLGTIICMFVNCIKEFVEKERKGNLVWKYEVGVRVIYHQSNFSVDRYVGCKILSQRYYIKGKNKGKVCYKVLAYTEDKAIWFIPESEILCTDDEFESFPMYNK